MVSGQQRRSNWWRLKTQFSGLRALTRGWATSETVPSWQLNLRARSPQQRNVTSANAKNAKITATCQLPPKTMDSTPLMMFLPSFAYQPLTTALSVTNLWTTCGAKGAISVQQLSIQGLVIPSVSLHRYQGQPVPAGDTIPGQIMSSVANHACSESQIQPCLPGPIQSMVTCVI